MEHFFKTISFFTVLTVFLILGHYVNDKIRRAAQHDQKLYEVVTAIDMAEFSMNGGGAFGYNNYYKWCYAKWRNDTKRTFVEKILFWNTGIIYFADNPPQEYQYPLLSK